MATHSAILASCKAIVNMLEQSWNKEWLNQQSLKFDVYDTGDFEGNMDRGVSLFVYRVDIDGTHRTYPARQTDDEPKKRPQLPINIHFILTPWGTKSDETLTILGWLMRVIEDNAVLPSGLLNAAIGDVFEEEEFITITPGSLSTDDIFRIFDQLPSNYQISVPYFASVLRIDSFRHEIPPSIVLEREYQYEVQKD